MVDSGLLASLSRLDDVQGSTDHREIEQEILTLSPLMAKKDLVVIDGNVDAGRVRSTPCLNV